MSAPVASSSSSSARTVSNNNNINRVEPSGKKQRVVRRRGRGNLGIDSDEEIEREVRSDSEEEEEAYSSDSSTDSDTEPASDLPHDHPTALTPNTSQSPEHVDPFFAKSGDWADDTVEEQGLPVIDFNDLRQKIPPSTPRRPPGQTARQAYQQRLEADPSYVPTVGEFWGHDDRLLDKDLRSLSGWWRGRWQGGLRGRGGRGRSFPPREPLHAEPETPVNREWTHDGFEELKQTENRRSSVRGRGSFAPSFKPPGRVWFIKKPEHTWTKQAESFLYFDPSSRPRPGIPATVRVKLPTQKTPAVRVPIQASNLKPTDSSSPSSSSTTASGSDYGDRVLVVRLPKAAPVVEEPSLEEVFTVRPRLVSPNPIPLPDNVTSSSHAVSSSISSIDPVVQQKLEQVSLEPQKSDPVRWIQTEEAVLRHPTGVVLDEKQPQQPLPTFHSPPPQSQGSPAYGSPYMYAPPPLPMSLPPGVAVDPTGMTYEVATGRPVYVPPPNMNMNMSMYGSPPPSMMHLHHPISNPSFDFIPAPTHPHHHRHRSTVSSSDFIPAGTTPIPINGYSMEYGSPMSISTPPTSLFSFPRQSSRIQIRAPGESPSLSEVETQKQQSQNSGAELKLRSNAAAFTPSSQFFPSSSVSMSSEIQQQQEQEEATYHPDAEVGHNAESIPQVQEGADHGSGMIGYIPYAHNPYHYHTPEPYGVGSGYNPYDYVDMSQVAPYEMYPPPPPPQGTVYYH